MYNAKALVNTLDRYCIDVDKLNYGFNEYALGVKLVTKLLKKGLGNRVSLLITMPRTMKEWNLNDEIPNDLQRLYIGLLFDPNNCFNIIEKGPGANLPEVCIYFIIYFF